MAAVSHWSDQLEPASRRFAGAEFQRWPTIGPASQIADGPPLVVLRPAGGDVYALAVDKIHDHEELVVKPAAPAVMATAFMPEQYWPCGSPILLSTCRAARLAACG